MNSTHGRQGGVNRRTALKLMGAGVLATRVQAAHSQLLAMFHAPGDYELQFLNSAQNELVDRLAEMIIPADDRSPGAREAKVSLFIDLMVHHSGSVVQRAWADGLQAVQDEARERFEKPFLQCTSEQQDQMLARMAAREERPITGLELFFARLKSLTIDGYYTSSIGIHQELRYKGNTSQTEFKGCTHPEHQIP